MLMSSVTLSLNKNRLYKFSLPEEQCWDEDGRSIPTGTVCISQAGAADAQKAEPNLIHIPEPRFVRVTLL